MSEEPMKKIKIRFKDDVPEFMGADNKTYGKFSKDDIAEIPEVNVNILVEKGIAEVHEPDEEKKKTKNRILEVIEKSEFKTEEELVETCVKEIETIPAVIKNRIREMKENAEVFFDGGEGLWKTIHQFLKSPRLVFVVDKLIHKELVGESKSAFLVFFTALSALTNNPANLRFSGRAAIGKTAILRAVLGLFPPEMLIVRMGLTKKATYYELGKKVDKYTREIDLNGKILVLLEESQSLDFLNEIKPLLSHDLPELSYSFVEKRGNKLVTCTVKIRGHPAYIGLTVRSPGSEENETRTILATPVSSSKKFGAVLDWETKKKSEPWLFKRENKEIQLMQNAIRHLKENETKNFWVPYMPYIRQNFPANVPRVMRDYKHVISILDSIGKFHIFQRPVVTIGDEKYGVISPIDYELCSFTIESAIQDTLSGLESDVREFYKFLLKQHGMEQFTNSDMQRNFKDCFGGEIGRTTLWERYTSKILDKGLLERDDSIKPHKYSVSSKELSGLSGQRKLASAVFSDEIKDDLKRKILSTENGAYKKEELTSAIDFSYSLSLDDNVKKVLERTLEEEYPETDWNLCHDNPDILLKENKKPTPSFNELILDNLERTILRQVTILNNRDEVVNQSVFITGKDKILIEKKLEEMITKGLVFEDKPGMLMVNEKYGGVSE